MQMYQRLLILILFGVLMISESYAQNTGRVSQTPFRSSSSKDNKGLSDKIFLGGGLGAQFGTYTYFNISPSIGYKITDDWHAGINLNYTYYEDRRYDYSTNVYGGGIFTRYIFLDSFFAQAEYEALNGQWSLHRDRYYISSVFVGGGYIQRFGNSFAAIMLLWNLNDTPYSPYANPVIRMTFGFGL